MTLDQLIQTISQSGIHRHVYHFTDESNIPSIGERGLLSKAQMRQEGWWPNKPGGNQLSHDLDIAKGIDAYVSLCCTQNHRMKYVAHNDDRIPNPRHLRISPEVLRADGVKIAFGIANATDTEIFLLQQALDQIDAEVLYSRTDWTNAEIQARLQAAERMEILVPHGVARELILDYV